MTLPLYDATLAAWLTPGPDNDRLWREVFQRIAAPINPNEMPEPMCGFPVTTDEE